MDASGNTLETKYYRWYKPTDTSGFTGGLRYFLSGPSYARMKGAGYTPETAKLGTTGGTLLNKINSIATTNPTYACQLRRGLELLDQGRVFRTHVYSVNDTGSVDTNTLRTDYWYDRRGLLLKTLPPGGLVTKFGYDDARRVTKVYKTDGGGDPAPGASDNWLHADDVTGDAALMQTAYSYRSFAATKERI